MVVFLHLKAFACTHFELLQYALKTKNVLCLISTFVPGVRICAPSAVRRPHLPAGVLVQGLQRRQQRLRLLLQLRGIVLLEQLQLGFIRPGATARLIWDASGIQYKQRNLGAGILIGKPGLLWIAPGICQCIQLGFGLC